MLYIHVHAYSLYFVKYFVVVCELLCMYVGVGTKCLPCRIVLDEVYLLNCDRYCQYNIMAHT